MTEARTRKGGELERHGSELDFEHEMREKDEDVGRESRWRRDRSVV